MNKMLFMKLSLFVFLYSLTLSASGQQFSKDSLYGVWRVFDNDGVNGMPIYKYSCTTTLEFYNDYLICRNSCEKGKQYFMLFKYSLITKSNKNYLQIERELQLDDNDLETFKIGDLLESKTAKERGTRIIEFKIEIENKELLLKNTKEKKSFIHVVKTDNDPWSQNTIVNDKKKCNTIFTGNWDIKYIKWKDGSVNLVKNPHYDVHKNTDSTGSIIVYTDVANKVPNYLNTHIIPYELIRSDNGINRIMFSNNAKDIYSLNIANNIMQINLTGEYFYILVKRSDTCKFNLNDTKSDLNTFRQQQNTKPQSYVREDKGLRLLLFLAVLLNSGNSGNQNYYDSERQKRCYSCNGGGRLSLSNGNNYAQNGMTCSACGGTGWVRDY